MRKNKELLKLLLAVALTAISVVIDVLFKYVVPIETFGMPFYAIPLVLGSIILGPVYGVMMALVGDAIGVVISGYSYLPLYALAAISWGLIPGIINRKYGFVKLIFSVLLAYLFANLSNTLANYVYFGQVTALATLAIRLLLIVPNSIIIILVTHLLYKRLYMIYPEYLMIQKANDTH